MMFARHSALEPPQLRDPDEEERSATPLELFFDLVFTAVAAQISTHFAREPSLRRLAESALLLLPVLWTWSQYTIYANRFDTDDALYRVMKSTGMVGVAFMGIAVTKAQDERSALFVGGFVLARLLLLALYARAGRQVDEENGSAVNTYLVGYGIGAGLWLTTLALPPDLRPYAWAAIVALELAVPVRAWGLFPDGPTLHHSHVVERHGLFTILLLAEAWLAIVVGVSKAGLTAPVLTVAAAFFLATTAIWWLYFDYTETSALERHSLGLVYVYSHLLLFLGLGVVGAGALFIVEHGGDELVPTGARWALVGGGAAFAAGLAVLRLGSTGDRRRLALYGRMAVCLGALALAALGGGLGPPMLVGLLAAFFLALLAVEAFTRPPASAPSEVGH